MWAWVTRMVLGIFPVLKMMRDHRDLLRQSHQDKQVAYELQHDIARRVHVMEWMSFPPPHGARAKRAVSEQPRKVETGGSS